MRDIKGRVADENITMIIVTHEMSFAHQISDKVVGYTRPHGGSGLPERCAACGGCLFCRGNGYVRRG